MLAERARAIVGSQTSGMRSRARRLRERGVRVINFAAGELDGDTSPLVKAAACKAVSDGRNQYTETMGLHPLRERLAERATKRTGVAYTADEVGVTAGAKQGLLNTAMVLFQPGDEVIIPTPCWGTFPQQVLLAGATPVFLPSVDCRFRLDPEELARRITPRTRGLILNTPHNPTGAVYEADALEAAAGLASRHDLVCVFDECYDELVYPPARHANIVGLVPEMKDRTVLVGSFSKSHCMAGWRVGFVCAPVQVVRAMSDLQGHTTSNSCSIAQYAALAALDPANDGFVSGVREVLRRRRGHALGLLTRVPGVNCIAPDGTFYLFPDVSGLLGRSYRGQRLDGVDALAEAFLEHARVAVVPGSAFGSGRHIRLSYAIAEDDVAEGMARIQRFAEQTE
jgi:aspartate aminotransferase